MTEKDTKKLVTKNQAPAKKSEVKLVKKTPQSSGAIDAKKSKTDKKIVSEIKASAKFVRVSPRKTRLVINQLKGLEAVKAIDYLKFVSKAAATPIVKLLNSAVANAENNFQIDKKDLFIKQIVADDGPTLKRYQPRAHGRSTMIRKRTSHVNLILGVKEGAKLKVAPKKSDVKEEIKVVSPDEVKKNSARGHGHDGEGTKGGETKGFMKGVFQRKTG